MKVNNTTIYPQIQAIEPMPKSKKSGVLKGVGFGLFVGGLALNYFGMSSQFGYGHTPGVMVIIVAFVVFAAVQKLSPVCEFPKTDLILNDSDINSPFHTSYLKRTDLID